MCYSVNFLFSVSTLPPVYIHALNGGICFRFLLWRFVEGISWIYASAFPLKGCAKPIAVTCIGFFLTLSTMEKWQEKQFLPQPALCLPCTFPAVRRHFTYPNHNQCQVKTVCATKEESVTWGSPLEQPQRKISGVFHSNCEAPDIFSQCD